ncbi:MAG: ABC transporter ATP-binding protein [Eubacteriales bacterium]|nr:ABC transporter ATP-binding protein [Eubacteriales bacterium]
MNEKIIVKGLKKSFHNKVVLDDISFDVKNGEFLSILGASGCGKTTLLRILMGIESADGGIIEKEGNDITYLESAKRGMGIVFQNYALFPNMTVLQNVKYALKFNKELKVRADEIARENIEKVGLTEHINKKPGKLSGGQQQRVAIARTLALSPDIILFDEPMSALDAAMRVALRKEIKNIQKSSNITMIYITHDQEEAFAMSDRIMVMNDGKIQQIGTPKEVYYKPANDYVREFVSKQIEEKMTSLRESVGERLD